MNNQSRDIYTIQLRRRAVTALANGQSCRQVSERFEMGIRSVQRLWKRYQETGEISARQRGGRKVALLSGHDETVRRLIKRQPDITLQALKEALSHAGIIIGKSALANRLERLGLSYKKNAARRRARQGGR